MTREELIAKRFPLHSDLGRIMITRDQKVIGDVRCERFELDGKGRWISHHGSGSVGQTSDGQLYAVVSGVLFTSEDEGRRWTEIEVEECPGTFIGVPLCVLGDDRFMTVFGDESGIIVLESRDRGRQWQQIGEVGKGSFDQMYPDGTMLELADGSLLMPADYRIDQPDDLAYRFGSDCQYMLRSIDGGRTWGRTPDEVFWQMVKDVPFMVRGLTREALNPGRGGSFPGCYETDFLQQKDGTILAAFRYSGFPLPWHEKYAKQWGAVDEPDDHGRVLRHIMLGHSTDAGATWQDLRPVADATGHTVLRHGDCNGELVEVPDGRMVLIHQRRYPRELAQQVARVSEDGGKTWSRDEYQLMGGFGYSGSCVLDDGTIITAIGQAISDETGSWVNPPYQAEVIRWRLD